MALLLYPIGLVVSFAGAYFLSCLGFIGPLKAKVTYLKLLGFAITFALSFGIMFWVIALIIDSAFPFSR